jgi:pimeloyl-ACP methyl ester carboxylesterase
VNPRLVLLPGLDGTGRLFEPLLGALPGDWPAQVVAYPSQVSLGYDALLPLVLEALPVEEPYVLVGESFGGPLALRAAVAATCPPQAVVLSASFIRSPSWAWPRLLEAFSPLARISSPSLRSWFLLGSVQKNAVSEILEEIQGQVSLEVFHTRLLEVLRVDAADALARCPCPVLYLRGQQDWIVPASQIHSLHSVRPDVQVRVMPTGHLVLQCAPQACLREIEDFLQGIRGH